MVSLEQVKLLESKVSRTIDYVKRVTEENLSLKKKLDTYQKRIDELEVLIHQFKDEQSRIEDGILSALDRLNQFEDAVEGLLSAESKPSAEGRPSGGTPVPTGPKKDSRKAEKVSEPIQEPVIGNDKPAEEEGSTAAELDIF